MTNKLGKKIILLLAFGLFTGGINIRYAQATPKDKAVTLVEKGVITQNKVEERSKLKFTGSKSYSYLKGEKIEKIADYGSPKFQTLLGAVLLKEGKEKEGIEWIKRAAKQNYAEAQNLFGILLSEAKRVEEAKIWWREAAQQNHLYAQYNLRITLYQEGKTEEAKHWYEKAADRGHKIAIHNLKVLATNKRL